MAKIIMNARYLLKQRKNSFLLWLTAILLCVFSVVHHLSQYQPTDKTQLKPISNFNYETLAQISRITIKNNVNDMAINASMTNGKWFIDDDKFPANMDKIADILRILQQGKLISPKTSNADEYHLLGLDHINATEIIYYDKDKQILFGLDIGDAAKIGDGRYIRIAGQAQSYLSDITYSTTTRRDILALPNINAQPQKIIINYSDGRGFQRHSNDDIAKDDFHQLELARVILQPKFQDMAMIADIRNTSNLLAKIELSADNRTIDFYKTDNRYYFIYNHDDYAYHINDGDGALLAEGDWDKYKNRNATH